MFQILHYIAHLNGVDLSAFLMVLVTLDIWAALYARAKNKGMESDSWRPVKKYALSLLPVAIDSMTHFLTTNRLMTPGGHGLLLVMMVLVTFWLSLSEFISVTSYLAIAEPKTFKWAQKFAINYALPEIQKKLTRLELTTYKNHKNKEKSNENE